MRMKMVAGNWKMNTNLKEASNLTCEILKELRNKKLEKKNIEVVLTPPFPFISSVNYVVRDAEVIKMAAQNVSNEKDGAYTGQVSCRMLQSVGVKYVIVGHSERRQYNKENNAFLKQKVDTVLAHKLKPIFCCGESLAIREKRRHLSFIKKQLRESLFHLTSSQFKKIVLAYEPIWAIGTGKTASPEQAQEVHAAIRKFVAEHYTEKIADGLTILYGGSCKPGNAASIFEQADIDGGLIGGASLKSKDFLSIVYAAI